jgi:hypothetical protein
MVAQLVRDEAGKNWMHGFALQLPMELQRGLEMQDFLGFRSQAWITACDPWLSGDWSQQKKKRRNLTQHAFSLLYVLSPVLREIKLKVTVWAPEGLTWFPKGQGHKLVIQTWVVFTHSKTTYNSGEITIQEEMGRWIGQSHTAQDDI